MRGYVVRSSPVERTPRNQNIQDFRPARAPRDEISHRWCQADSFWTTVDTSSGIPRKGAMETSATKLLKVAATPVTVGTLVGASTTTIVAVTCLFCTT